MIILQQKPFFAVQPFVKKREAVRLDSLSIKFDALLFRRVNQHGQVAVNIAVIA